MSPGIVQKIFRDHYNVYQKTHSVSQRERRAARNIITCRTSKLGYHVDECPNGHHRIILNNSCKHRSCPQCGLTETEVWLERRKLQALNCSYHHIIFTIHHDLHVIWLWNRKLFTNLLFLAAWHSLSDLLGSKQWLGVYTGAIAVFQSWDDEMNKHCHLHFIVPAGGLDKAGKWKSMDGDFLIPTPVLAAKFRGKLLSYLKDGFKSLTKRGTQKPKDNILVAPSGMRMQQCLNLFNKLGRVRWHADIGLHINMPTAYLNMWAVTFAAVPYLRSGLSGIMATRLPLPMHTRRNMKNPVSVVMLKHLFTVY